MIKVLHIITRLEKGGSSKNVLASFKGLPGFESHLACGKSDFQEDLSGLDRARCFFLKSLKREISPFSDLKAVLDIYKILKKVEPDIIHTHTSKAGAAGRIAAFLYRNAENKVIIVHTPHGHLLYGYFGPFKTFIFKIAERFLARFTDYFIALTEGERKESIDAGIGKDKNWKIIHSGISFPVSPPSKESSRAALGLGKKDFAIGSAGRLEKVKGMEIFVRAAAELERKNSPPGTRYLIAGEGPLKNELTALAAKYGLASKLTFIGFTNDIYSFLSALDLYIQPSLNEAMGRSVLEAQFCGLPCLVSDACGLPYVIKPGESGLLFKKGDSADLAKKISLLYYDKTLLEKLSLGAQAFMGETDIYNRRLFGAEAMNAKLSEFYDRIVNGGKTG